MTGNDDDEEGVELQRQPLGKLEVLADLDVAALAGLIPGAPAPLAPGWYSDVVGEDLREIQVRWRW